MNLSTMLMYVYNRNLLEKVVRSPKKPRFLILTNKSTKN